MASDEYYRGEYSRRGGDWTDQMQVCINGHIITAYAISEPESRKKFCSECGSPTINTCSACGAPIRGHRHIEGVIGLYDDAEPDKHCENCGSAFPWQDAAIENLRGLLREGDLTEQEAQEFESALPDILTDTPKTQLASLKLKRLLPKLGNSVYGIVIKVVSDVASETAKKALGLG
jgi:hypothetical protein